MIEGIVTAEMGTMTVIRMIIVMEGFARLDRRKRVTAKNCLYDGSESLNRWQGACLLGLSKEP